MELLGLIVIILLYVIILYFINKNKATELVKDLIDRRIYMCYNSTR